MSGARGVGGGETSLVSLAAVLNERCRTRLLTLRQGLLTDYARERNVDVECVTPAQAARILCASRPHVAIFNDYFSLVCVGPVAKALRIPCVWVAHGWWYSGLRTLPILLLANSIVCVSAAVERHFTRYPLLRKRLSVIPLGVDITCFKPSERDRHRTTIAERAVVSIIGRFQRIKNHDVFVRIGEELARRRADRFSFRIVGSNTFGVKSDEDNYCRIRALVRASALLSGCTEFVAHSSSIVPVLQSSDFVIVPSDSETFGMVIVESMACGKVVLATNVGGPSDIITHGVDGFLLPPRDVSRFAVTMLELVDDLERYRKISLAARKAIEQRFDIRSVAHSYERLISSLSRPRPVVA